MGRKVNLNSSEPTKKMRPALTPEARENQMIALAYDVVEERLRNRTATSQETTHFLKLGSMKTQLELEKIKLENELIKSKTKAINSSESADQMYKEAIAAFKSYSGAFLNND